MTGRLIVVSNRIPTEAEPAGGLVVALHECLRAEGGLWVGSNPDPVDTPADDLRQIGDGAYQRLTFDLTREDLDGYYLGYSNAVLWPLFHRRADLMALNADHARIYRAVNARIARLLAARLRPEDRLWVHDYHLLPLAHELRALGVTNRIGFFLHTPFPLSADLHALPERAAVLDWLAAFDLVGLQTQRDVAALLEVYRGEPDAALMLDGSLRHGARRFRVMAFPIGIDVDAFVREADRSDGARRLHLPPDEVLIIGVDRLDYSKGLVNRFEAFGTYLDRRAPGEARATFLQIAPPSRAALDAYQDIRRALETMAGSVNGAHAELDWTPIRYIRRNVPRPTVAGLLRRANVALVTPFADGMNLVAKEYVAAQQPDDPGVLILSHFAGAAERMTEALLVNPYDVAGMAEAIRTAVAMPRAERRQRHAALLAGIREHDIARWTAAFLGALAAPPPPDHSLASLFMGTRPVAGAA